jgi:hypothetical protein
MTTHTKDPDAVLDYVWDWGLWLDPGDTIVDHTVTADPGITVASSITTVGGRTDDRTQTFLIRNR